MSKYQEIIMTDLQVVKSGKGQEKSTSTTTYEEALAEYESIIISKCYGCWDGCPDCLSPEPTPPNPEDYKE